ncbi:uncharacterized protein LAJ45_06256 [Morchella importuna]|uniref:uncharacterized protein n=1 Tax=Morchella importuna TaxID=1174673 RepID=UPI001E8D6E16|nr:uncharacterized protein LAJ45_06256 [Morchella importuna]KAH8149625.1 hypothetical protein LAJ45_06256 [Morchella importuna]
MATVKPDPGTKLEPKSENQDIDMTSIPSIKPESDDELYEDAGDLDMVEGSKAVWLVKLPSFVAERWNDIDEDEEIVLGVVKVNPNNNEQLKLSLERNEVNGDVPTEYDLRITNMEVTNTFVFTEKDMPGFSSKMNTGGVKEGEPPMPPRFLYQDRNKEGGGDRGGGGGGGGGKGNWGKPQRFQPYIRKAIPKRTALAGTVRHECSMSPVLNTEYKAFQASKFDQANTPRVTTKFLDDQHIGGNLLAPGTTGAGSKSFSAFIKQTEKVRKPTDNKAARIPHAELVSALFTCFGEHEYWSMKGLRERLVQPEQYLKSVLEEIAQINRNGPYVGKWQLKDEYKPDSQKEPGEGGEANGGAGDVIQIDDDDDDDLVEMEDVPM